MPHKKETEESFKRQIETKQRQTYTIRIDN